MVPLFVNSDVREMAVAVLVVLVGATSNALANDGHPVSGERMRLNTIVVAQNDSSAVKSVSSGKTSDELLNDDDDDDDLLEDNAKDNDPLKDKENTEAPSTGQASAEVGKDARAEHEALFAESRFPAAGTCGRVNKHCLYATGHLPSKGVPRMVGLPARIFATQPGLFVA